MLLLFVLLTTGKCLSTEKPIGDDRRCVWYGECGGGRNCVYDGPPVLLEDPKAAKDLLRECPQFQRGPNNTVASCCDAAQVEVLATQILAIKALTARCPPCYRNLRTIICGISCEPNMGSYSKVDVTIPSQSFPDREAVRELTVAFSKNYLQRVIDSCRNVQGILGNALDAICMSSHCTPELLLKSLTNEALGAPAKYNKILSNRPVTVDGKRLIPYDEQTFNCSQSVSNEFESFEACSCADCISSCPTFDFNDPKEEKIGSLSVIVFIMIILSIVAVLIAVGLIAHNIIRNLRLKRKIKRDLSAEAFNAQYETAAFKFQEFLRRVFTGIGYVCATKPKRVILPSVAICFVLCMGLIFFKATSDPIELWGVIGGRCIREKEYFDLTFNPFYRTIQIYLRPKNQSSINIGGRVYGPIFRQDLLLEVLKMQNEIKSLTATYKDDQNISLTDLCFAPLSPENLNCTIQSVTQYFDNSEDIIRSKDWLRRWIKCINSPFDFDCLSDFESPVLPYVALGGFEQSNYEQASVIIVTILNNNHLAGEKLEKAKVWEKVFLDHMKSAKSDNFEIVYSAERSIEDEVSRASKADLSTIIVSYVIMFVYMSIFLGSFKSLRTLFVDTRLILGLCALFMIVVSVLSSFGFYSYLGFETTIIVLEVTPFLLLAVGSGDNFIFVNNYMRKFHGNEAMKIEEKVAANLGEIGPSLLLSSVAQAIAFGIGAVIPVGAIRVFALYSFFGVIVKFVLQVTLFVSIFTLDCKRQHQGRYDLMCCLKTSVKRTSKDYKSISYRLFENYYCPLILNPLAKVGIVVVFVGWFIACLTLIPKVKIGLDQKITFPKGSYVIDYLNAIDNYAAAGPPVYIVIQDGYDYVNRTSQNYICSSVGCNQKSITSQAIMLPHFSNRTYIEYPPASWMDDYFSWISNEACCTVNSLTNELCNVSGGPNCVSCPTDPQTGNMRPKSEDFVKYLQYFLNRNPDANCPRAGHAMHGASVDLLPSGDGTHKRIGATNFMAYSVVPRNTSQYIAALEFSRQLSDDMSKDLLAHQFIHDTKKENRINPVFIYSVFYPFYEQYISLAKTTMLNIIYSIIGVFIVTFLLLGMDFHSSLIVLLTLIMTMVDLFGIMFLSGVDLNAISVVNLVMAVGISVEFYVHIVRDYAVTCVQDTRARTTQVLSNIGSSIFIGVTVPEMMSVAMLSAAESEIFQIYFFRMYLSLILMCTLKALVFLPVLLTYLGPKAMSVKEIHNRQASIRSNSALSIDDEMEPSPSTDMGV